MAKFCSNCGAQLQETSKFCVNCGGPVHQQVSQPLEPPEPSVPAGEAKKRSKLPLILGIAGGAAVVIVVAVILILGGARAALDQISKADYYEIGNDSIPSVKLALGEERKVTGVSTSTSNGVTMREITYSAPDADQGEEMSAYLNYVREKDGFLLITDVDFSGPESWGGLGRNSVESGYEILLQIAYDTHGYTITLVRQQGEVTPSATPSPAPTPTPALTPEPTPSIAAESAFELIDSGAFHMNIFFVGGDSDGTEMELYKMDGRTAMVLKGDGMNARRLTMDGKFYTILDEYETVVITEIDPNEIPPVEYDSSQLTYVGEGSGEWGGATYPCSEYNGVRGEQMFYFMDKNVLKGIRSISPTGNTIDCEIRVLDGKVPDDAFEWPEHYAVDDPDAVEPWIGLWRYEGEDGVELIHLKSEGEFFVDSRLEGLAADEQVMEGSYAMSEDTLTFIEFVTAGNRYENLEFPVLLEGDTLIVGGEDDASYYYRVPKEDEAAVLADPLAPYANKPAAGAE